MTPRRRYNGPRRAPWFALALIAGLILVTCAGCSLVPAPNAATRYGCPQ